MRFPFIRSIKDNDKEILKIYVISED